jgi:hypothetical protein
MRTYPNPETREEPAGVLRALIVGVVGLYLAGFAAILLDELVFRTFVLSRSFPEWAGDAVGIAYWPLIQLFWLF